ncbi:DNA-binding transcriptional MocR family regulator [Arthrobacter sp. CAN_A6]|uniref:aminotransferase-like domain-containing protein n=1 Tax=Arthrobacter sp. CAN_A6 TaxID=2787721 RepID=UPI0018CA9BA8
MTEAMIELGWAPDEPTSRGVANAVSRAIRDGFLQPGTKLPSIRAVASQLELSPTTISAAWSLLARSGAIHTDGRRGTRVADIGLGSTRYSQTLNRQSLFTLDLSTGVPDRELLPDLEQVLKNLTSAVTPGSYLDPPVVPELIEVLRQDWPYDAETFAVVDGAMDALELATRALVRFGDRVIVEHPTFPLLLDLLEAAGAEIVGVPMDDQGMLPGALEQALATSAAAVILQPRAQNPTGVSLTPTRAKQLAGIIRAADVTVVEDDSAGYVAWTPAISLGQWLPERTLHVRSFSKSHGPDLRLAAMSGPANIINEIISRRQLGQGWTSRLLQRILLGLLTEAPAAEHISHARREYRRRREAMVTALAGHGVQVNGVDGINIWIPVADESAAMVRLASQGIGVAPGTPFAVLPRQQGHIRVTIGAVSESIPELAELIAGAAFAGSWSGGR